MKRTVTWPTLFTMRSLPKDFARAADVAERAWQSMDGTFQTAAWLGWIKQLPEEVIRIRPVLCTQIGWAFTDAGEPEASESRSARRRALLADPARREWSWWTKNTSGHCPRMIAMARAYNAQVQGDLSATVKYAELALQLIPEDDLYRRAQATVMLKFTHWANGRSGSSPPGYGRLDEQHAAVGQYRVCRGQRLCRGRYSRRARPSARSHAHRISNRCSWRMRLARKRNRSRRIIIWDWRCCIMRRGMLKHLRNIGMEPRNWASTRRWSIGLIAGVWRRPA